MTSDVYVQSSSHALDHSCVIISRVCQWKTERLKLQSQAEGRVSRSRPGYQDQWLSLNVKPWISRSRPRSQGQALGLKDKPWVSRSRPGSQSSHPIQSNPISHLHCKIQLSERNWKNTGKKNFQKREKVKLWDSRDGSQ